MLFVRRHKPVVLGLAGQKLTSAERKVFAKKAPMGIILFKRNIDTPAQTEALISDTRAACGGRTAIWIDQEGGRVQRFGPPHWPKYPPAEAYGTLYQQEPERALSLLDTGTRLLAKDLRDLSVQVNCLPLLDLPQPEADKIIGDRAYAADAETVTACARVVIDSLTDMGVVPIIKHIPGHGRALLDSHLALPEVTCSADALWAHDMRPFQALKDAPVAMSAHIVYRAWDDLPATLSAKIVATLRNELGFKGLLVSDDLAMKALAEFGDLTELTHKSFAAGMDIVLYCEGDTEHNQEVLEAAPDIPNTTFLRLNRLGQIMQKPSKSIDPERVKEYQTWLQG